MLTFLLYSTMKNEAAGFSETSVAIHKIARCHVPEECNSKRLFLSVKCSNETGDAFWAAYRALK
jgi:hypothetical protein